VFNTILLISCLKCTGLP